MLKNSMIMIVAALTFSSAPLFSDSVSAAGQNAQQTGQAARFPGYLPLDKFQQTKGIMRDKCMTCHTRGLELPFYAQIPGIRAIIEKDFNDGLRALDLGDEVAEGEASKPVSEPTLAKMEWVILNNTMPPSKFVAIHWGSRLSDDDKKVLLNWVYSSRSLNYATGLSTEKRAGEPVQPLPDSVPTEAKKVAVGHKLFNDTRLSVDNTVSCASCHDVVEKGGTDKQRFAEGVRKQFGDVNAPTVFNALFNRSQFWDGRAKDLQEQVSGPPFNPVEMGSKDWDEVIAKLKVDKELTAEFTAVYPNGWSGENISDAVAEYEKALITPNSRFDRWLKGDDGAITSAEIEGYERFKAYRCASCHVGKTLGGQSFEYMDLKKDYFADRGNPLGSDKGYAAFTKRERDIHKFKVPTLRNIELTAPYLHDGTPTTLDETVRIMGVYLSGFEITQKDRNSIVAFLRTLTGEYLGKTVGGSPVEK